MDYHGQMCGFTRINDSSTLVFYLTPSYSRPPSHSLNNSYPPFCCLFFTSLLLHYYPFPFPPSPPTYLIPPRSLLLSTISLLFQVCLSPISSLSLLFSFTLSFSPLNSLIFFLSPLSLFYALCSSVVSPLYSLFSPLILSVLLLCFSLMHFLSFLSSSLSTSPPLYPHALSPFI